MDGFIGFDAGGSREVLDTRRPTRLTEIEKFQAVGGSHSQSRWWWWPISFHLKRILSNRDGVGRVCRQSELLLEIAYIV